MGCDLVAGCRVHAGFAMAHSETWDAVLALLGQATAAYPTYKIIFTGHSLGGAVATLSAANARAEGYAIDLYTYGSPRVGNEAFASFVTAQAGSEYRVTHTADPIARLPPLFLGYSHVSPEYWLSTGNSTTTEYTTADVVVCEGTTNLDCNGATSGFDMVAHSHYFRLIDGCKGSIVWKRDNLLERTAAIAAAEEDAVLEVTPDMATTVPLEISDAELIARLNEYVQLDIEFVESLKK